MSADGTWGLVILMKSVSDDGAIDKSNARGSFTAMTACALCATSEQAVDTANENPMKLASVSRSSGGLVCCMGHKSGGGAAVREARGCKPPGITGRAAGENGLSV